LKIFETSRLRAGWAAGTRFSDVKEQSDGFKLVELKGREACQ